MDASAGEDPRDIGEAGEFKGDFAGAMHGVGAFADSYGENGVDAYGGCAFKDGEAVLIVARTVEMGVGVDEHSRLL